MVYACERINLVVVGHHICDICYADHIHKSINDQPPCVTLWCLDPLCVAEDMFLWFLMNLK